MNVAVKWGLILAVLVSLVSAATMAAGLHRNPLVGGLLTIVLFIAINVGVVFWALKQTASQNGYGMQLLNGVVLGVVGGVLILVTSWLMLSYLFPNALTEAAQANIDMMRSANLPDETIRQQAEKLEQMTPMSQAWPGMIGTVITSTIVAAIVAIFQRKK